MANNALAPCVTRPSAAIVFTLWLIRRVFVLYEVDFQPPVPCPREVKRAVNTFLCFLKTIQHMTMHPKTSHNASFCYRNVHIFLFYSDALCNMRLVHCGVCATGQLETERKEVCQTVTLCSVSTPSNILKDIGLFIPKNNFDTICVTAQISSLMIMHFEMSFAQC